MEALSRPLDGDRNKAGAMLAILCTQFSISTVFVSSRLFLRITIEGLGLDDFLMGIAWVQPAW